MMQIEKYQEDILLCKAVRDLDTELQKMNIKPFELHVCGGFALLLQEIRKEVEQYTDIDYIGEDLSADIESVIAEVGHKYNFGSDWINNDVLLTGSSLEDLEYTTGKLHFQKKMDLSVISVYALCKKDLLRMKVIAIDTSLSAIEFGGEFTRMKDFNDIKLLAEDLKWSLKDIQKECSAYICSPYTYDLVKMFIEEPTKEDGIKKVDEFIEKIQDDPMTMDTFSDDFFMDFDDFAGMDSAYF